MDLEKFEDLYWKYSEIRKLEYDINNLSKIKDCSNWQNSNLKIEWKNAIPMDVEDLNIILTKELLQSIIDDFTKKLNILKLEFEKL